MLLKINKYLPRVSIQFCHYYQIRKASDDPKANVEKQVSLQYAHDVFQDEHCVKAKRQKKLVKVSLLGIPNAGKSTIINRLMSRTLCSTSMKVHTTMQNAKAIFTKGDTQVVFIDTPGVLTPADAKKYKFPQNNNIVKHALKQADVIGVVQDVTNRYHRNRIEPSVLQLVKELKANPSFILIFNKIDSIKNKELLLEFTKVLTSNPDLPKFDDVFMISALDGSGIQDLRDYLISIAKPGAWMFAKQDYTDQMPETIIENIMRAQLLDALPHELPYCTVTKVAGIETCPDGRMIACIDVYCQRKRQIHVVVRKLRTVCRQAEDTLRNAFKNVVHIKVTVRLKRI